MTIELSTIIATTIADGWFQLLDLTLKKGRRYTIQQGSFVGQTRLELDYVSVLIKHPYAEPWDQMLPDIPPAYGIPDPVAPGYVEAYMPYLLTDALHPTEQYTYGSRIAYQIPWAIDLLKKTPNTNQAILQVAGPQDNRLPDPPCLRHIDCRVIDGRLVIMPYFRSWDLWAGFPANLAGLAVLQKLLADEIDIESGEIIAASKGLHLYQYVEQLAKIRTRKGE